MQSIQKQKQKQKQKQNHSRASFYVAPPPYPISQQFSENVYCLYCRINNNKKHPTKMEICLSIHTNSYCENQEYIEITPSLCMKTKPLYSTKQNKTLYSWLGERESKYASSTWSNNYNLKYYKYL